MSRLKTEIWVQALLRRAEAAGAYAAVVAKGDLDAGAVVVIVEDGARAQTLYTQARNADGDVIWNRPLGVMTADHLERVQEYLARARQRDPDVWVVEILDKQGRAFLTEDIA